MVGSGIEAQNQWYLGGFLAEKGIGEGKGEIEAAATTVLCRQKLEFSNGDCVAQNGKY